ncbi:hypothetical protein GGD81_001118 [Rhodobium orientis]|uniref:ASPIC/UnbV domain-containing protein n=1 Tax=Rhodobium orientis TaxID=34017 RepID=A0A327JHX7_9HYPH|nr:CRTAC1 family protein [Rhodobium orientis]MBB4302094.1 hypothetical protein [Rhodobium orientis]MBK5951316.1 hypothetical protein [Rhodobium orientis]RAI25889.1 hypothetical protein CH339_16265 [Rhodobium orientis]
MSRFIRLALAATFAALAVSAPRAGEQAKITADIPVLHEEAKAAGIDHSYSGPWEFFVGGGVASFDCDGDRKPELFFAGGKEPAKLYRNRSRIGGELRFEPVKLDIGERTLKNVLGAYPLDIDDDGHMDLAVLRLGRNALLKGGPDCSFSVANRAWAFDGGRAWTTAFSAIWEADQKFPTLAFGNYVDRSAPGSPWGTCHDNALMRSPSGPRPDYGDPLTLSPGYCALSMLFTDWNRSGEPSLRVSNDRQYYRGGEEQLWHVPPGRPPTLYTRSDGWQTLRIWGMGITEGDLDADGYPEYALTSMGDTKIQTLDREAEEDRPVYRDIAFERGATAHRPYAGGDRRPSTGWHSEFADINNDSLLDLFIAKGNVEAMPDFAATDPDNLLLARWDDTFAEAGSEAGIALPRKGRGAAVIDLNLDGALDLVVVNRSAPVSVFRNCGARAGGTTRPLGNWLHIQLSQKAPNRNGIGAILNVKTGNHSMTRKLAVGGGHASGSAGWVHVGLGTAERAEVRVKWPDGFWSHPYRVFANQFVVVARDAEKAAYWYPLDDEEPVAAGRAASVRR